MIVTRSPGITRFFGSTCPCVGCSEKWAESVSPNICPRCRNHTKTLQPGARSRYDTRWHLKIRLSPPEHMLVLQQILRYISIWIRYKSELNLGSGIWILLEIPTRVLFLFQIPVPMPNTLTNIVGLSITIYSIAACSDNNQIFLARKNEQDVRRTDRQTECSSLDRVCIPCSAVKTLIE